METFCSLAHIIRLRIYSGLINPYLTYGISVWGQANKSVLNCLLILQKKIIRIMNFANYQDHAIRLGSGHYLWGGGLGNGRGGANEV